MNHEHTKLYRDTCSIQNSLSQRVVVHQAECGGEMTIPILLTDNSLAL